MPVDTGTVGTVVGASEREVTVRQAMAYAAGVPDRNPRYFDDTAPAPVSAPPLFAVSLEWALRPALTAALGLTADEAARVVHATHDLTIHRLPVAGDRLTTTARVVAVEARRPGAYVVTRFDTADAAGRPVLTTFHGSLYRGVACAGPDRVAEAPADLPTVPTTDEPAWEVAAPIPREAPHVYTECANIWNPIHTERAHALAAGLPDTVVHGTQTLALAARELVNREAGGDPALLARIACRFAATVIPGTTVAIRRFGGTAVDGGRAVSFAVRNGAGQPAIRDGIAVIRG